MFSDLAHQRHEMKPAPTAERVNREMHLLLASAYHSAQLRPAILQLQTGAVSNRTLARAAYNGSFGAM